MKWTSIGAMAGSVLSAALFSVSPLAMAQTVQASPSVAAGTTPPPGHWVAANPITGLSPQTVVGPPGGSSCPPNTTYSGANAEYSCMATAPDGSGHVVWIRQGYYDYNTGNGFGETKFYHKHNVWLGTVVNDIEVNQSGIPQSNGRYLYGEYYVGTNGQIDQQVLAFESRNAAPTGNEMGIITAYCTTGTGGYEATCPDWVNTSQ